MRTLFWMYLDQRFIDGAGCDQFHRRNPQTLLIEVAIAGRTQPSPDIGRMGDAAGESHQNSVTKYRHCDVDVGKMTCAEPRIIGDHDVTRLQRVARNALRKCRTVSGSVQMKEGMLWLD